MNYRDKTNTYKSAIRDVAVTKTEEQRLLLSNHRFSMTDELFISIN
jgi:hypothetical protein